MYLGENSERLSFAELNVIIDLFAVTLANGIKMHLFLCHPTKDFICVECSVP